MSITKTLGGDRLGSGNKMKTELHNYYRSSFNLSRQWRSSMCPGALVPFFVEPALNGDTFDIDLDAMVRTIPTQGPLMGTFKLQMDFFQCPVRLYQGILHNNPINIGLEMNKIKMPKIALNMKRNDETLDNFKNAQLASNCLLKYLGMSGIGLYADNDYNKYLVRYINAVPLIAYYDIFKNYYANKQEENAYVISTGNVTEAAATVDIASGIGQLLTGDIYEFPIIPIEKAGTYSTMPPEIKMGIFTCIIKGQDLDKKNISISIYSSSEDEYAPYFDSKMMTIYEAEKTGKIRKVNADKEQISFEINANTALNYESWYLDDSNYHMVYEIGEKVLENGEITLVPFPLENIDKMRQFILSKNKITDTVVIDALEQEDSGPNILPYKLMSKTTTLGKPYNCFKMNGLCVKTYQSDLFNSWVNTEWYESENGIQAITTIDTTDGLNLDTLNLAQKVYNMLNRIAVSGGTYQDWQEAVYGEEAIKHCETPIYLGGMSNEIVFSEVVGTAQTSEENKLGQLAGKGTLINKKGGHIIVKIKEPSFIIGIVSITPRIDYTQGNKWYLTDLFSVDDFHKPALDAIGFQNLMAEQAAWFGTKLEYNENIDEYNKPIRQTIGKVPAWINYMTAVDEAYGDFAEPEGKNFMVLARNYEPKEENGEITGIADVTTYIDPQKFNYAFAYQNLDAQNFWVQIQSRVTARRLMSAKVIPNL